MKVFEVIPFFFEGTEPRYIRHIKHMYGFHFFCLAHNAQQAGEVA